MLGHHAMQAGCHGRKWGAPNQDARAGGCRRVVGPGRNGRGGHLDGRTELPRLALPSQVTAGGCGRGPPSLWRGRTPVLSIGVSELPQFLQQVSFQSGGREAGLFLG